MLRERALGLVDMAKLMGVHGTLCIEIVEETLGRKQKCKDCDFVHLKPQNEAYNRSILVSAW